MSGVFYSEENGRIGTEIATHTTWGLLLPCAPILKETEGFL
jgi:hypothetical protein